MGTEETLAFVCMKTLAMLVFLISIVPVMLWVERRGAAYLQNRLGPNRVGPLGLAQAVADVIKFFWKEDPLPSHVKMPFYWLAPWISLIPSVMAFAVIPFAAPISYQGHLITFQAANLDIGVLYCFAIASLGVYGIIIAGYASDNAYAVLGALRSSAQRISYELSMSLSVIALLLLFSSVQLSKIVEEQGAALIHWGSFYIPSWGVFLQPLGFVLFLTSGFAETNRLPFDLPECDSEIIAGYHLEYGSMKFAMFMMAEYLNMATISGLLTSLYFGGWHPMLGMQYLPEALGYWFAWSSEATLWCTVAVQMVSFTLKLSFFMWLFVWVRWTLPRFRYDQLMALGWKIMLPLSFANLFVTALVQGWLYLGTQR